MLELRGEVWRTHEVYEDPELEKGFGKDLNARSDSQPHVSLGSPELIVILVP